MTVVSVLEVEAVSVTSTTRLRSDDDVSISSMTNDIPTLQIPTQYKINWDEVIPELDPMRGGKIRQGTSKRTDRGLRKRAQVECFYYI